MTERSLDLCAVGLGQGGGNLAAEWRRRGHRALVLNTAHADMRAFSQSKQSGLDVPERHQLYIGVDGGEGAGRDPAMGRAAIEVHADEIRDAVRRHLDGADAILLMAGLGGGTGSAVDALVRALRPLDIPLITCTTLPGDSESGIAKVNAVKAVNGVVDAELDGRIFVDNARLAAAFPNVDLVSWYPKVNGRILAPIDDLNRLNARSDIWSIKSFDGEDLRKLLLSGGVLQTLVVDLPGGALQAKDLVAVVTQCVDGGEFLAAGLTLDQTAYLALVVTGSERALKATSMQAFDEAARELKKKTNGGAVYEGIYVSPDDQPTRAYVLASSLALPRRVQALLVEAQKEGGDLARKIQSEIPTLSTASIDQLELFRAPRRRSKTTPPAPAGERPRPVDAQVRGDVASLRPEKPGADQPAAKNGAPEATILVDDGLMKPDHLMKPGTSSASVAARTPSVVRQADPDMVPRIGTGRWAEGGDDREHTATAVVDDQGKARLVDRLDDRGFDAVAETVQSSSGAPKGRGAAPAPLPPHMHPPISGDADDDVRDAVTAPTAPGLVPVADLQPPNRVLTSASIPLERTEIGAGTAAPSEADQVLHSVGSGGGVAELQAIYEDLIDRFKQAPDRRGRERVARRLIDDSRSEDVEIRALAVWAMVKLGESGFRRALAKAANDGNPEISKLALTGLERIGALNEPAT